EKGGPAQRAPRFCLDPAFLMERPQSLLLETGMQLDLVDRGRDAGLASDPLDVVAVEVGDADRANPTFPLKADKRLPGLDIEAGARARPVDEVEVDRLALELSGAGVEG